METPALELRPQHFPTFKDFQKGPWGPFDFRTLSADSGKWYLSVWVSRVWPDHQDTRTPRHQTTHIGPPEQLPFSFAASFWNPFSVGLPKPDLCGTMKGISPGLGRVGPVLREEEAVSGEVGSLVRWFVGSAEVGSLVRWLGGGWLVGSLAGGFVANQQTSKPANQQTSGEGRGWPRQGPGGEVWRRSGKVKGPDRTPWTSAPGSSDRG
jgi:hypothetical protein